MLLICYCLKILKTGQVVQQEELKAMLWMNKHISKNLHLSFSIIITSSSPYIVKKNKTNAEEILNANASEKNYTDVQGKPTQLAY
jgi:hypothetical protein